MSRTRLAVWGDPIAHSKSPLLHAAAYEVLGLDWEYERRQVTEAEFAGAVRGLDDSWRGLSLTMPLKDEAFRIADSRDAHAELTGVAPALLDDAAALRRALTDALVAAGASVRQVVDESFSPQGVTVLALLAESHASVHTWPEHGTAHVDVFTCGASADPVHAVDLLAVALGATGVHREVVDRVPQGGKAGRRRARLRRPRWGGQKNRRQDEVGSGHWSFPPAHRRGRAAPASTAGAPQCG